MEGRRSASADRNGGCSLSWTGRSSFSRGWLSENKYFNYTLAIFGLIMVVLTVLLWPVGALIRKHYAVPGLKSSGAQAAAWCAVGLHPLHLFLGGWLAVLQ